jgi:hypothetical protein
MSGRGDRGRCVPPLSRRLYQCPVSLDLVRPHLADLRRTISPETPFSGLSHLIWSVRAILSAVSHSIWSAMAILSVASVDGLVVYRRVRWMAIAAARTRGSRQPGMGPGWRERAR